MIDIKNRKIQILAILLLLSLFSILYMLDITKNPNRTSIEPLAVNTSPIDDPVKGKIVIESLLKKDEVSIPKEVYVYTLSVDNSSPARYLSLANKLGFNSAPTVLKDINYGNVFFWYATERSLRVVPSDNIVEYGINADSQPLAPFLPDKTLVQAAEDFLKRNIFPDNISGQLVSIDFIKDTPEGYQSVPKSDADLAEIRFVQKIDNYIVVNETVEIGTINVKITKDGIITSVYVDIVESVADQRKSVLKQFDDLVLTLHQAKLQSLDNGRVDILITPASDIEKVVIDKAELVYYKPSSNKSSLLQPIFNLTGKAFLRDGRTVSALLHLPASK